VNAARRDPPGAPAKGPGTALRLFAYGTLQVGQAASSRLEVIAAEPGTMEGFRLYDSGLGWPFVAPGRAGDVVHGQVLTLAGDDTSAAGVDAAFARADEWEGYDPSDPAGSLYLRQRVEATTVSGHRLEVHVYLSSEERLQRHHAGQRATYLERGIWTTR